MALAPPTNDLDAIVVVQPANDAKVMETVKNIDYS